MYSLHFLVSHASDQPIEKITFAANQLSDAIERAESLIKNTYRAGLVGADRQRVIGFLILDNDGREVHRHYLQDA
jgi:hypothetical protein